MEWKGLFKMKDGCRVKICGTTNINDALLAAREGADYFGVVIEVGFSRRSLTIEEAVTLFLNPPLPAVALVFHMKEDRLGYMIQKLKPFAVQFLSQEDFDLIRRLKYSYPGVQLWQSVHLPSGGSEVSIDEIKYTVEKYIEAGVDLLLYDTVATVQGQQKFGGTGMTSNWSVVRKLMDDVSYKVPVMLAGGIKPENVEEAIHYINPDGIDLCSGVEAVPGKKDADKVRALMEKVKGKG
jgi:phosphoribosylanthranilate isomerase